MADVERQPSETDLLRRKLEEEVTAIRGRRTVKVPKMHKNDKAGSIEGQTRR